MNEQWKNWEGQTIDGKFPLRQFLASTDHSAVFLTQLPGPEPKNAAIKFLFDGFPNAEMRLALWKRAEHLSHPNLLAIFDCGRCHLGESDLPYVVMEYAEENLGQILPHRALTLEEASDFLNPTLDALVYLHAKGLAHGHIKPSNLLASQDSLKLACDTLLSIGAQGELQRPGDVYDAPELQSGNVTSKSDVWSLGVTLVEALTQKPPFLPASQTGDPAIADGIAEPCREIIRHCLRRHEMQRWSVGEIAARLNPPPLAAAAVAGAVQPGVPISPLSVPLATEPAVPLAKLPRRSPSPQKAGSSSPFEYFVPAVLGAAVIIGLIFAIPKMFHFQSQPASATAPVASEPPASRVAPSPTTAESAPESAKAPTTPAPSKPERPAPTMAPPSPAPAPAVLRTDSTGAAPARTKAADEVSGRGEVLDQVLPEIPQKALDTIQGTVRVLVKVQVDASGNVSDAALDSPGPSKYFAGFAEKAARKWQFTGAENNGHGVPSEWLIRFEFTSAGVHAFPQQTAP